MKEIWYNENGVRIEVDYGNRENAMRKYIVKINGKTKVFKGETAYHDMMRYVTDNAPWETRQEIVNVSIFMKWW